MTASNSRREIQDTTAASEMPCTRTSKNAGAALPERSQTISTVSEQPQQHGLSLGVSKNRIEKKKNARKTVRTKAQKQPLLTDNDSTSEIPDLLPSPSQPGDSSTCSIVLVPNIGAAQCAAQNDLDTVSEAGRSSASGSGRTADNTGGTSVAPNEIRTKEVSVDNDNGSSSSDSIIIVSEKKTVMPLEDYPHFRSSCGKMPHDGENDDRKKLYCPKCFCVVCDELVEKCPNWAGFHFKASHADDVWMARRKRALERKRKGVQYLDKWEFLVRPDRPQKYFR